MLSAVSSILVVNCGVVVLSLKNRLKLTQVAKNQFGFATAILLH
jgi:hypothetical protein